MKESAFLTLTLNDWVKGLITTVIAAVITALYEGIIAGKPLDLEFLKTIGMVALTAGLAYILNKLGTNSADEFGKTENSSKAIQMRMGVKKGAGILLLLLMFSFAGSAQSPWKGFWKPDYTPKAVIVSNAVGDEIIKGTWNFRPTFGLQAVAFYYDKDMKSLATTAFNKMGIGIRYQHNTLVNGEVVGDYSINAILFSDFLFNGVEKTTFTPALTFNALKYLNAGIAYDGQLKKPLILTALTYNF